jgi:hypothetical protein
MMKIAFAVAAAAAVLTTAPLVTPAKAQGVKMAQVGVDGPGGVTVGPRQRCRMETTTIERDDGRRVTRRQRVCD